MKILYHHRIASRDGMDVHITELTNAFRMLGHELRIVSPQMHQNAEFGGGGETLGWIRKALPKFVGETLEILYDHLAYRRLRAAYLEFQPDILYERANLFLTAGEKLKNHYQIPFFLEVNAPLFHERDQYGGLGLKNVARKSEERVWRSADAVFPVSDVLAGFIRQAGADPDRIHITPNGADTKKFSPDISGAKTRAAFGLNNAIVLGFTGFVRDWHRIDLLIELAAQLRDQEVHVLIVGDGPAAEELKSLASRLDIRDRVHFSGLVSREQMPEFVAAFDIAFQPAATPYASPLKLVEYLAMAKPTVAPQMPNIVETVGDAGVVYYFKPERPEEITAATELAIRNLAGDAERAKRASQNVRTWLNNAQKVCELAASILGNKA